MTMVTGGASAPLLGSQAGLYGTSEEGCLAGGNLTDAPVVVVSQSTKLRYSAGGQPFPVWRRIFNFIHPESGKAKVVAQMIVLDSYKRKLDLESYFADVFHKHAVADWISYQLLSPADAKVLAEKSLDQEGVAGSFAQKATNEGAPDSTSVPIPDPRIEILPPLPSDLTEEERKALVTARGAAIGASSIKKFIDEYVKVLLVRNPSLTITFEQGFSEEMQSWRSSYLPSANANHVRSNEHFVVWDRPAVRAVPSMYSPALLGSTRPVPAQPRQIKIFASRDNYTLSEAPGGMGFEGADRQVAFGLQTTRQCRWLSTCAASALLVMGVIAAMACLFISLKKGGSV